MGWFRVSGVNSKNFKRFSSPLGVGLVLDELEKDYAHTNFSSPSGVGLVPEIAMEKYYFIRFSSPSGDGLVPAALIRVCMMHGFRPRVGMGWFSAGTD